MRLGKARRKLCEEICPYELVTEDVQAKLAAVLARHKQLNSIEWLKPALRARNCALLTPFGTLRVSLQEDWKVFRNDEPLVHYRCDFWGQHDRRPAVFTDYDAAKGAALLHALDGWGVAYNFLEPTDTGLFWWLPQDVWAAQQAPEIRHDLFPSDLDDRYEFGGAEKLLPLIEPWGMPPARNILEDCKATCKAFRLPMSTFMARLRQAEADARAEEIEAAANKSVDAWFYPLSRLRGRVDPYGEPGVERITSAAILDILEVPMRERRRPVYQRVSRILRQLGWVPIRVRDFRSIRGENVRGYLREVHTPE